MILIDQEVTNMAERAPVNSIHNVACTVKHNVLVNSEYKHLCLKAPKRILDITPGQFFNVLCPETDDNKPYLRRPMSIYGADLEAEELHFLYKVQGEGTRAMATMVPGDEFSVVGPLGIGFTIEPSWKHLVLVARGVGLATLAPLARMARENGCELTAICSARSPDTLMSIDYFKQQGADIITLTDSEGTSSLENLDRELSQLIQSQRVDAFYTCGSNRILKLLQKKSIEHDIPGQIAIEQQMACGLGMCFCCVRQFSNGSQIASKRVCMEGPVFDIREALAC